LTGGICCEKPDRCNQLPLSHQATRPVEELEPTPVALEVHDDPDIRSANIERRKGEAGPRLARRKQIKQVGLGRVMGHVLMGSRHAPPLIENDPRKRPTMRSEDE
jgi:hypothetical protein